MDEHVSEQEFPNELNLGIAELDDQHRAFFLRMMDLRRALTEGVGARDKLMQTLRYLETFISEHFLAEEQYMRLHNYPGILLHRAEHEVFAKNVADLKKESAGPRAPRRGHLVPRRGGRAPPGKMAHGPHLEDRPQDGRLSEGPDVATRRAAGGTGDAATGRRGVRGLPDVVSLAVT